MNDETILTIIELCLAFDEKALEFYRDLSKAHTGHGIQQFWLKMASEENRHLRYWQDLQSLAQKAMLPQVFDQPHAIIEDLKQTYRKMEALADAGSDSPNINLAFLRAYRLEFYLLHPALATLFHYGKTIETAANLDSPEDDYQAHISGFIEALNEYGNVTPEMELLGETLQRLWMENRNLNRLAYVDQLTGVLNRRGFFNAVLPLAHLAQRNDFGLGVLMVDIDHFKAVNDRYGHQNGDAALAYTAERIQASLRRSDVLGRYGGEEFIVLLPNVKAWNLEEVAEKVCRAIAENSDLKMPLTVSVGGAVGNVSGEVGDWIGNIIKAADDALYQAKKQGRNRSGHHFRQFLSNTHDLRLFLWTELPAKRHCPAGTCVRAGRGLDTQTSNVWDFHLY